MSDSFAERTIASQTVFEGKIVRLETHTVELPNGRQSTREVIRHPGAVAVLAEPTPGTVIMVEQFRKAPEETLLELPAGKLEPGEHSDVCARRELQEETGFTAQSLKLLYEFYTSPGFADEKIVLFYATGLTQGASHPDEDEFVRLRTLSREEVRRELSAGKIRDAKTLVGLLWWLGESSSKT
ncbi:NUDIX hydrolase [Alicyclobacillus tolerans]|uniref:NUDIX domain-containing protein n=1 Tax=Alicyclobacillus tolerans TaxID=90970 RepID=UPI001F158E2E|nr:NUDIX hydrolase [Alicyclobacillus tolerans]MCF8563665.1 NUDIX hydrolase [Alicyclobacillus tolerans]